MLLAAFQQAISQILGPQHIIEDELLRYAYSTDASLYRMLPQLVLIVENENQVIAVIKLASLHEVKLTFRAAGTSLCGQAVTDQVLVMLAQASWQRFAIAQNGQQITLEPGIIGADANKFLKAYKRQIGPDPGSLNSAKIGGIVANNSSGMCCGTSKNTYATLVRLRAVLANGTVLDSSDSAQMATFKQQNQALLKAIQTLHTEINADSELSAFIGKKFAIKNTSGYSLNAFLDYHEPIKIIERLLVGSEGTLGFVSQVTLATVSNYEFKALNLIYGKLSDLIKLTLQIAELAISAVELLDYYSLKSVAQIKQLKPYLIELADQDYAAIMVEVAEASQDALEQKIAAVSNIISNSTIIQQSGFSQDEASRQTLWKARSGILPTLAGQRPIGSTVLIEDVAVELILLPQLIADLRQLFEQFGYTNGAIFGHVLAGNIHFVLTPDFNDPQQLHAYDQFMHAFTRLVAEKYHGSLKAEHGSGRNIAPFALVEWGQQCWDIMWRIKHLFDPQNILNPDVKLTRDNTLHTKNLKQFSSVDPKIDKCMECGFCEPVCPSRKLSLTPRQRNSVARKMTTLNAQQKQAWQQSYQYYAIDTCATTSMCQTVCPVDIDTGAFIHGLKPPQSAALNHGSLLASARKKVQLANTLSAVIGRNNLQTISQTLHNKFKNIPIYLSNMPQAQSATFVATAAKNSNSATILLVPACPNRIFAATKNYPTYPSQLILEKMGFTVEYPAHTADSCCGQMHYSAANQQQQQQVQTDLAANLSHYAQAVTDNSSCAGFAADSGLAISDINQFIVANIQREKLSRKYAKIALHIDCSSAKHNFDSEVLQLLNLCAHEVLIPEGIKCCGFAGDKGFRVPELNASSLAQLAPQVSQCSLGVTFNRNCQIGLSHHSGIEYISFVELILACFNQ